MVLWTQTSTLWADNIAAHFELLQLVLGIPQMQTFEHYFLSWMMWTALMLHSMVFMVSAWWQICLWFVAWLILQFVNMLLGE